MAVLTGSDMGIDFAAVDENGNLNWKALKLQGLDFAYLNATPGNSVWDQAPRARAAGVVVGPYVFPPIRASVDPVQWVGRVPRGLSLAGDLPLVLDVELPAGLAGAGFGDRYGDAAGDAAGWVEAAVAELDRREGYLTGLYASDRVLTTVDTDCFGGRLNHLNRHWLWLAYYAAGAPPVPPAWGRGNWWIHQDHGDLRTFGGGVRQVDTDVFNLCEIGDTGPRVAWLQERLGVVVDGDFGPGTEEAVRAFQRRYDLTQDGVVGPRTFAHLAKV